MVPHDLTVPQQALWWLRQGKLAMGADWATAHELCQLTEGDRDHDLVHALCHWIEGDLSNRDYWYRRVAPWQRAATVEAEWQAISLALS
ncbi:MAG: hypothetical protein ABI832_14900 [bacterium]